MRRTPRQTKTRESALIPNQGAKLDSVMQKVDTGFLQNHETKQKTSAIR
jgi:hypothetical protein